MSRSEGELPSQLLVRRNKGLFGVESRDEVSESARLQTTSANASIRQHTSAYVSIRDEVSESARLQTTQAEETSESRGHHTGPQLEQRCDSSIRQHTSAYASIGPQLEQRRDSSVGLDAASGNEGAEEESASKGTCVQEEGGMLMKGKGIASGCCRMLTDADGCVCWLTYAGVC